MMSIPRTLILTLVACGFAFSVNFLMAPPASQRDFLSRLKRTVNAPFLLSSNDRRHGTSKP
jgi:hypothetical protein